MPLKVCDILELRAETITQRKYNKSQYPSDSEFNWPIPKDF